MSQRESVSRCIVLIKCLLNGAKSYEEIEKRLRLESDIRGVDLLASKRTFQRDISDIREIFGINIAYNFSEGLYRIESNLQPGITDRIIESFETLSLLDISNDLTKYLQIESTKAVGSDMLPVFLKGIRSGNIMKISYSKFNEGKKAERTLEPLGIKEFRNRYYLVATDLRDSLIKTFSLDRISDPEITEKRFSYPESFKISEYFKDCFGIIRPDDDEPEEVFLTFDALQGKYIKSLPLHPSQVIISESKNEVRVRLRIYITHDFIMELLSHGDTVKVISPESLVAGIKKIAKNILKLYK